MDDGSEKCFYCGYPIFYQGTTAYNHDTKKVEPIHKVDCMPAYQQERRDERRWAREDAKKEGS